MTSKAVVHPGENKTPERPLSKRDRALLLAILGIQSDSGYDRKTGVHRTFRMQQEIRKWARSYGAKVRFDRENVYVTKGKADLYPCYVAHTDTVHDLVPDADYAVYHDPDFFGAMFGYDIKTQEYRGVGGDDKVGIFIALAMVRDLPVAKAAFFRDEEVGCVGAGEADMRFFDDVAFVIECDRRGNADHVDSASGVKLAGEDWLTAIQPAMDEFGYRRSCGSLTDVKTLKTKGLNVACCNMSCGYYQPHTDREYVLPGDVGRTLAYVKRITELTQGKRWEHTYTATSYTYHVSPKGQAALRGSLWGGWDDDDSWDYSGLGLSRRSGSSSAGLENFTCPTCRGKLYASGWCWTCRFQWTMEDLEDAAVRAAIREGLGDDLPADPGKWGDDCPACLGCGGNRTTYDETEAMCFCWDCGMYYDPSTGRKVYIDWYREWEEREGGAIDADGDQD